MYYLKWRRMQGYFLFHSIQFMVRIRRILQVYDLTQPYWSWVGFWRRSFKIRASYCWRNRGENQGKLRSSRYRTNHRNSLTTTIRASRSLQWKFRVQLTFPKWANWITCFVDRYTHGRYWISCLLLVLQNICSISIRLCQEIYWSIKWQCIKW